MNQMYNEHNLYEVELPLCPGPCPVSFCPVLFHYVPSFTDCCCLAQVEQKNIVLDSGQFISTEVLSGPTSHLFVLNTACIHLQNCHPNESLIQKKPSCSHVKHILHKFMFSVLQVAEQWFGKFYLILLLFAKCIPLYMDQLVTSSVSFCLDEVEFMHVSYCYVTNSNKGKCVVSSGNHVCALELKEREKKRTLKCTSAVYFKTC